jgi:hypothetical protein
MPNRYEPFEGLYLYFLGLVVIATHLDRFWFALALVVVPLVIGPLGR